MPLVSGTQRDLNWIQKITAVSAINKYMRNQGFGRKKVKNIINRPH